MTTLLIDIGNTRLKWRFLPEHRGPPGALVHVGSADDRSFDIALLNAAWQGVEVARILYASVATDRLTTAVSALCASFWPKAPIERIASLAQLGGISNGYEDPASLGADRMLAMIGARAGFGARALLVASIGTATTLDAVDATGHFLGGAILPGPMLMADALAGGTAKLPHISPASALPDDIFGTTTKSAIRAGILHAQAGAIERSFRLLSVEHAPVTCVISGGGGHAVAAHLPFTANLADNLVLDGLAALAATSPEDGWNR